VSAPSAACAGNQPARYWPLLLLLTASAIYATNDNARLEISPDYGQILSDDLYEQAEGWRAPPMFESEWRAPRREEPSRIRFGYDSAYEELRARERAPSIGDQRNLDMTEPATLFRWNF
jgi:hypothetical protein